MRTSALCPAASTRMRMSSTGSPEVGSSENDARSRNAEMAGRSSGEILASTSSSAAASPATMPADAAARMPLSPPVCGTTTLLTFLMMLGLTDRSTVSGRHPSVSRASAAA